MKRICLDEETLMDYIEDRLPKNVRERVERHLCNCSDCRELFMMAVDLNDDSERFQVDPVPPAVTQRAIDAVEAISKSQPSWGRRFLNGGRRLSSGVRSLLDAWNPGMTPQPADLRRGHGTVKDELIRDHITGSGFEAVIEIEKSTATHFTIQVELTLNRTLDSPLRVGLFSDAHEIASETLLDEAVQFGDIPYGSYKLIFSQANQQLEIYTFEV